MDVTFRVKLVLIIGAAALALLGVATGSALIGARQTQGLADVEGHLVPKLRVGPELTAQFRQLTRAMEEAVAAQDHTALDATEPIRDRLFEVIGSNTEVLGSGDAAALRWAIQDYYQVARNISERLIAGETGERLVDDVPKMQAAQARAAKLIEHSTALGPNELSNGFASVRAANRSADVFRLGIGLVGLVLVLALSFWASRSMLSTLRAMSTGFARFATGDFDHEIPVTTKDELGVIAREANQMATSLGRLSEQRARLDWLKTSQVGLSDELRGELEPEAVARRALCFLAERIGARAGALYVVGEAEELHLYAQFAGTGAVVEADEPGPVPKFRLGEGLVGQAALSSEVVVVEDPPADYVRIRSGLGEAAPRALVFLPLTHLGKVTGVIEVALLDPCTDLVREVLSAAQETLVISLEVARSRRALGDLLEQTQAQAARLAAQEEELRLNNQELEAQQEELRRANQELEAQRAELTRRNAELEDARRRVHQKVDELAKVNSYKSQFLANMSHELRTPLNSMLLLSHLLADNDSGNLTSKQVEFSKTIYSAGQDLLALINQVLDLSKIEAGKQEVKFEQVPLSHFVEHASRAFGPMASDKGLAFHANLAPGLPAEIATDRQRVERILTNLLGNAIKFTEQGEIRLSIGRPEPGAPLREGLTPETSIALAVSDTGIGIAAQDQDLAFAPFEQIESKTDRHYAGTGLGLAIARESARLLGGELQLHSRPGEGSTFTVHLPERPVPDAADAGQPTKPRERIADDRKDLVPGEAHLLLIEDDAVLAEQLIELIRARHFKVVVAASGQEGLRLAADLEPRGIVLDVKLPDIDGWTVMERLRADPTTRRIPVHFVSAVDAPAKGLAMGAIGYLTKPATRAELVAVIRALTPPEGSASRKILVVEDGAAEGASIIELLRHEELDAEHVTSAGAALGALGREPFGCMILDLGLPDMDGLGLLEALRERLGSEMPRVVVHTGRALTRKETRELEAYAEAVILKDGSSAERLLEEIRLFVRHVKDTLPAELRTAPREPALEVSLSGVKVLLADDDMRTVYALSALLRGKGAEVLVAETGREALNVLETGGQINAVLMDLMMPEMDGYEAMQRLRRNPRFAGLPVIALTAKAMKGERERCIDAGASDYLAKPVEGDHLLATLQKWIHRADDNGTRRHT